MDTEKNLSEEASTQSNQSVEKEHHTHSIYSYTALIFVVAILMIVLAFFGQSNIDKNQIAQPAGNSITEKSAALSDENLVLRDKNADLTERLEMAENELKTATESNETKDKLISASLKIYQNDLSGAATDLSKIDKTSLEGEDLEIYVILKEETLGYEPDEEETTPEVNETASAGKTN